MLVEEIHTALETAGASRVVAPSYQVRGVHVDALVPAERLRDAVQTLREKDFLIDHVTAVDAAPDLMVVYHFSQVGGGCRAALKLLTPRDNPTAPSIYDIYPGANWHERETHDFYGVVFDGHPDLSPLILPEDAVDLRPLRKSDGAIKGLSDLIPEFAPPPGADGEEKSQKPRPKREKAGEDDA